MTTGGITTGGAGGFTTGGVTTGGLTTGGAGMGGIVTGTGWKKNPYTNCRNRTIAEKYDSNQGETRRCAGLMTDRGAWLRAVELPTCTPEIRAAEVVFSCVA